MNQINLELIEAELDLATMTPQERAISSTVPPSLAA